MLRIIPLVFFRFVLPLTLLLCCLIRPSLFSLLYGLLVLVWPFIPNIDAVGTPACTKRYLVTCIFFSCLAVLAQLIFHVTLLAIPPYGSTIPSCNDTDYILRTIGLQRLDEADAWNIFRIIGPDICACLLSVVTAVVCFLYKVIPPALVDEGGRSDLPQTPSGEISSDEDAAARTCDPPLAVIVDPSTKSDAKKEPNNFSLQFYFFLLRFSDFVTILLLALIGVIWPCAISAVYFLAFLLLMTWWSVYLPLKRRVMNGIKIFLLIFCASHMVLLYLYQLQVFQERVVPFSFEANLTGLIPYVYSNCPNVWILHFKTGLTWSAYVNPMLLFLFYIYCSFQYLLTAEGVSRHRIIKARNTVTSALVSDDDQSSVHEELLGTEGDDDAFHSGTEDNVVHRPVSRVSSTKAPPSAAQRFSRYLSLGAWSSSDKGERPFLPGCLAFVVRHSYALALVTMMAWAITYHCWLAFVWLILACFIWLAPNSRKFCLWSSPFIVFYAEALLCLEFIYGIRSQLLETPNFNKAWPEEPKGVPLKQIGLITPTGAACIPLLIKLLYSLPFWITMRLFLREKYFDRNKHLRSTGYGTFELASTQQSITGNSCLGALMVKYWIYIVGLVLLLISIRMPVVAYSVCYMAFFIVLITVLQISFQIWRFMLYLYWLVLVTFSIIVLLTVYTYQFHGVPEKFHEWTNWPNGTDGGADIYKDLGLIEYDSALLFVQLLTPISFLIVVIMQMKFFHTGFLRLTNISALLTTNSNNQTPPADQTPTQITVSTKVRSKWLETLSKYYNSITDFLWRFAEIHISKLICFGLIMLAIYEVCAVNFVFVLLVSIMLSCRRVHTLLSVVACLWAAAIVLAKMLFQMSFVDVKQFEIDMKNCTIFDENRVYPAQWAGFDKTSSISYYLKGYIIIFVLLTFQAVVHLRQKYCRVVLHKVTPARGIIFPNITRRDADESVVKCLQYFVNYWFYKFGVEATFIMLVIDIGIRMDGVAFLYAICLLILVALPRPVLARLWYFFVLFLAIFIPIQYAVCVGLPPSSCIEYPWTYKIPPNLVVWLYMPAYNAHFAPYPHFLIADFFVFLSACCQLYVFNIELSPNGINFEGGDNTPIDRISSASTVNKNRQQIVEDGEEREQKSTNPVPNFINYTKSYLDALKMFVFVYFHWITLIIIFVAGVGSNSLFALFYLIAVFSLLWKGNDLYLETHGWIKCRWIAVLVYNVVAIILKVGLQVVGCVYWKDVCHATAFIRLFSITCVRNIPVYDCQDLQHIEKEEAEIVYDGLCFAFLIIQLRIFGTWYFKHTIADFRAERILASRGAILMNQLVTKEMNEQQEKENKIYDKLIDKTKKIRDKYVKQFEGKKFFTAETYPQAKRGGDYYMFEYDDDEGMLELEPPKDSIAPEIDPDNENAGIGPIQLTHSAFTKDFDFHGTVSEAEEMEKRKSLPTTSKSAPAGIAIVSEEDVTVTVEEKKPGKLASALKFVKMFMGSCLNHCSLWFNKWSRDYRYVGYVLKKEKRHLKESLINELESETSARQVRETIFHSEIQKKVYFVQNENEIDSVEKEVQTFWMEHNIVVRFFIALYYLLVSHTELLCYIMIILNMMGNASVLALPLPFFAFYWGTLCSPRPPILFWIVLITYTEAVIIVKCICQFGIFFNTAEAIADNDPFDPRRIIGVEKKSYYAAWDVALLMVLFFHRYVLKALGLWKDAKTIEEFKAADTKSKSRKENGDASPNVAIKANDDITAETTIIVKSSDGNEGVVIVDADQSCEDEKKARNKARCAYCSSFPSFFRRLLHPLCRYIMDLYAMMFLCDIICFLILAFGYSSFGVAAGQGDVVADISSNKVPLAFVVMLITMMMLIIIDRGIYLRKNVVVKLIFQYLLVLFVHLWIFFGLPAVTDKSVYTNTAAQLWYFVKCVYFLLSAWQIRNGYPSRILGNLLTKRYNLLNYSLFTAFMAVPFLFELRTLIDWIWTETSMPLFDYFSMENMYSVDYPVPKGTPKGVVVKYGMGCPILLFIVLLLWLPLLLFALVNSIGMRIVPVQARFTVIIEGYPPLYTMDAQNAYLMSLTPSSYNDMTNKFIESKQAMTFIRDFTPADTLNATFRASSLTSWGISSPSRHALKQELNGNHDMKLTINYEFVRPRASSSKEPVRQTAGSTTVLNAAVRKKFYNLLEESERNESLIGIGDLSLPEPVDITHAFPTYIEIPSIGEIQPARPLLNSFKSSTATPSATYATLRLTLSSLGNKPEYWIATMIAQQPDGTNVSMHNLEMTAFVDKVFPSAFDAFTSGGIIGVYVVVVLAVGRILRGLVVSSLLDVIISEMPDVDKVLQLCLDIFLVREAKDFILELDLFAKLIFLFRSPETLIRWTRPKAE